MVRPKDQSIWKHFRNSEDKSAICIYCDHKYKFAHISKMRNHLLKCTMYPDIIKEDIEKKHLEAATTHTHNVCLTDETIGVEIYNEGMQPGQSTPHDTDEETEEMTHKAYYMDPLEDQVEEERDSEDAYKGSVLWKMAVEKRRHMVAMRKMEFQIKKEMLKQAKIKTRMMLLELQLKRKQLLLQNKLGEMS
ncbi:uncharacterized protein LOC113232377 [Hyposmocoma kahamanoa]|uniref:uncharacterized protein LOC113232377 n=1 Tax=Hyposmocoma kahamanoa TaxID=1477025 RepID=UPI000E6D830E|nr:uncharacterized protein LOC113232377 [Hyposmocoma kahamanoa]